MMLSGEQVKIQVVTPRLINYLYEHGHNTPFESVTFTFDVKAPIFVFPSVASSTVHSHTMNCQHVTVSYRKNFTSRTLSRSRANQPIISKCAPTSSILMLSYSEERWSNKIKQSFDVYKWMLEQGCPRELARTVLPVGTYSHMFRYDESTQTYSSS